MQNMIVSAEYVLRYAKCSLGFGWGFLTVCVCAFV